MTQSLLKDFGVGPLVARTPDQRVVGSQQVPRLQSGGTANALELVDAVRLQDASASVFIVTLCWRNAGACGANRVVVANELGGAAYDLRPHSKPKRGDVKQQPSSMSHNELCGLVAVAEQISDLLLESVHTYVVVTDGYPKGHIYARLAVCMASRCLKMQRCAKRVTQRATPPNDASCKEVLARFHKCRSVAEMHTAAAEHYATHLAHVFP
jgi:hypothetical protein